MDRRPAWRLAWIALAVATACGGSSATKPKPLQFHFKEKHIASVATDQKKEMLAAQAEYNRAKQEHMKAESDYANSKSQLDVAKNQAKQAHLQKDSADSQRDAAEKSENFNQINLAKRDQRVAEVTERAADQKVDMLKARRSWLEKYVKYTGENLYAVEAKYELAKAKVARANNIAPPDFAYQAYVEQYEKRRQKAEKLKGPADGAKQDWMDEKKDYEAKRRDENEARGVDTAAKTPDKPGKADDKK